MLNGAASVPHILKNTLERTGFGNNMEQNLLRVAPAAFIASLATTPAHAVQRAKIDVAGGTRTRTGRIRHKKIAQTSKRCDSERHAYTHIRARFGRGACAWRESAGHSEKVREPALAQLPGLVLVLGFDIRTWTALRSETEKSWCVFCKYARRCTYALLFYAMLFVICK